MYHQHPEKKNKSAIMDLSLMLLLSNAPETSELPKLGALRGFVSYVPSRLTCLRVLIFMHLNYAPCAPYLLFACLYHSLYKISY